VPRRQPETPPPTWTPNQVVAGNLLRLRQRRGLTQGEVARLLSSVAGKDWSEAMVAHAERSVTGNRVREFTADDSLRRSSGGRTRTLPRAIIANACQLRTGCSSPVSFLVAILLRVLLYRPIPARL
jgi:hypothetical protein